MNKSNCNRTTGAAAETSISVPRVDSLDILDHEYALDALDQWFFNYTLHCIEDGMDQEIHDMICSLFIEFKALLEHKKFVHSKKRA